MELYIIDTSFNRLGFIDDYISIEESLYYDNVGTFILTIDGGSSYVDLLQLNRIIVPGEDLTKGYLIKSREYLDENSKILIITAYSLTTLLHDRLVLGQQKFSGTAEAILRALVDVNMISSTTAARNIPGLVLGTLKNLTVGTGSQEIENNKNLGEYMFELAAKNDISFDIKLNHTNKQFVFEVYQGTDRSVGTSTSPVIFSKDFDNIISQNFVDNIVDEKTTAIVVGQYTQETQVQSTNPQGQATTITEREQMETTVIVNDNLTGFNRKEVFISATDIKKTYNNGNQEVTITDQEFQTLLQEKGKNSLTDYKPIQSLESVVDPGGNFVYGVDYFLGDKVSIRNDDLNLVLHTRIMSIIRTIDRSGEILNISFGSNIPTLVDKIKKKVK